MIEEIKKAEEAVVAFEEVSAEYLLRIAALEVENEQIRQQTRKKA